MQRQQTQWQTQTSSSIKQKRFEFADDMPPHVAQEFFTHLSSNPNAGAIQLAELADNLVWSCVCKNPSSYALTLIRRRLDIRRPSLNHLCLNTNPDAVAILRAHRDELTFRHGRYLSRNINSDAVDLLFELGIIDWMTLCDNTNLKAMARIRTELDANPAFVQQLCFPFLMKNPQRSTYQRVSKSK